MFSFFRWIYRRLFIFCLLCYFNVVEFVSSIDGTLSLRTYYSVIFNFGLIIQLSVSDMNIHFIVCP